MTAHEKAVEAATLAALQEQAVIFDLTPRDQEDGADAYFLGAMINSAITAYLASMEAKGWVMAPMEPTGEMIAALEATERSCDSCQGTVFYGWSGYRAMIDAAMLAALEAQP